MHACWRCQIQVPETNGLCIAREEFITYGHSSLRRSLRLPLVGRLRLTFRANFSFTAFPNLPPTLRAKRTKRRNSIIKFSFTTFPFSDSDLFDVGLCPVTWESNRTLVVPLDRGCVLSHAGVVEARILDADSSSTNAVQLFVGTHNETLSGRRGARQQPRLYAAPSIATTDGACLRLALEDQSI